MSLWRLEWLRLVRTRRLVALAAVFGFFGLTSAPLTRYLDALLERFGGGEVRILSGPPVAADAVGSYVSNAGQLGLVVFVLVSAAALTIDAHRETAVFLRTRVRRPAQLVLPRFLLPWLTGSAAFTVGVALTWYGTALLLGGLPVGPMLLGTAAMWLYLAFVGSVAAVVSTRSSSVLVTAAVTLGVAVVLGIVGSIGDVGRWLPSGLVGALSSFAAGGSLLDPVPGAVVTLVATVLLLVAATRLAGRREL